jgi:flagellar biosynthesis/type III secretory pathway protein FliH
MFDIEEPKKKDFKNGSDDKEADKYWQEGYTEGYEAGKDEGYEDGHVDGHEVGYEDGYVDGKKEAFSEPEGEGLTFSDRIKDGLINLYSGYAESPTFKSFLFDAFEEVFNVKITVK